MSIEFNDAIRIAAENISKLVNGADNIVLEGALLSADGSMYEITYSYDLERPLDLGIKSRSQKSANIAALANLMGRRRQYKVFLVDAEGKFRGFKNYKET